VSWPEQLERAEYEDRVLAWFERYVLAGDPGISHRGNEIYIEDVRLEKPGTGESLVIILFRESSRPECLFGRRAPAVEPGYGAQGFHGPEVWAGLVWTHLEEDVMAVGYGLPDECDPGGVTWIGENWFQRLYGGGG
jgi:hypothetical protein